MAEYEADAEGARRFEHRGAAWASGWRSDAIAKSEPRADGAGGFERRLRERRSDVKPRGFRCQAAQCVASAGPQVLSREP
jgi:hypothetical protein